MDDSKTVGYAMIITLIIGIVNYIIYKIYIWRITARNSNSSSAPTENTPPPASTATEPQQADEQKPEPVADVAAVPVVTDIGSGFIMVEKKEVENASSQSATPIIPATINAPKAEEATPEKYEDASDKKPNYYEIIGAHSSDPQDVIDAKCTEMKRFANPLNGMDINECARIKHACSVLQNPESRTFQDAGHIDPFVSQEEFDAQFANSNASFVQTKPEIMEMNETLVEYNKAFGNIIRKRKQSGEREDGRHTIYKSGNAQILLD